MKPNPRFLKQPRSFWANIRIVGQQLGYTERGTGQVKVHNLEEIVADYKRLGLSTDHLIEGSTQTEFGSILLEYLKYRAEILNVFVEPRLMDRKRATLEFTKLKKSLKPTCPIPLNKQKGKMKAPAYLTGIVNMLVEANSDGLNCDFDQGY